MAITGKDAKKAAQDVVTVKGRYPDVTQILGHVSCVLHDNIPDPTILWTGPGPTILWTGPGPAAAWQDVGRVQASKQASKQMNE